MLRNTSWGVVCGGDGEDEDDTSAGAAVPA